MPRTADKFAFFVEMAKQQEENKYTDEQLTELMTEHFPNFAGPHMINGYRRAYNKGLKQGFEAPASPLLKYDAEGNAIPEGKRKVAKPKAEKAETTVNPDEDFEKEVAASKARSEKAKAKPAAKAKAPAAKAAPAKPKLVIKKK
jgi:hypothetical protein